MKLIIKNLEQQIKTLQEISASKGLTSKENKDLKSLLLQLEEINQLNKDIEVLKTESFKYKTENELVKIQINKLYQENKVFKNTYFSVLKSSFSQILSKNNLYYKIFLRTIIGIILALVISVFYNFLEIIWYEILNLPVISDLIEVFTNNEYIHWLRDQINQSLRINPNKYDVNLEIHKLNEEKETFKQLISDYQEKVRYLVNEIDKLDSLINSSDKITWYNEIKLGNWDWILKNINRC
jgi:hypothetical protein